MTEQQATPGAPGSEGSAREAFIVDPDLRRLFDYWCSKRQGRPMPAMRDIDPLEIGWALARVFLLDYSPEDGFRYRLAGSDIAKVFGRGNLKGLQLSDILPPDGAELVRERWTPIVTDHCALSMKGMVYLAADYTPIGERLLLPLADGPDGPATGVLGMTVCEWVAGVVPQEVKMSRIAYLPVSEIP